MENISVEAKEGVTKSSSKQLFNFGLDQIEGFAPYDNQGAYNTLKEMMERKDRIDVSFGLDRTKYPCAFIESKKVGKFKLQLNASLYGGLITYLMNGTAMDVTDVSSEPIEAPDYNFSVETLKSLVNGGLNMQYVPLFRESPKFISCNRNFFYGKVFFRVSRTEDLLEFLREHEQID